MRAICLSLAIMAFNLTGFSQDRVCDLSINLLSPQPGYVFTYPGYDSCVIQVKNNGPDTILSGDFYGIRFYFGGIYYVTQAGVFTSNLVPGDSVRIKETVKMKGKITADSVPFCVDQFYGYSDPNYPGRHLAIEYRDEEMFKDNKACTYVRNVSLVSASEISKTNLVLFPNPAATTLYLNSDLKMESCRILSLEGKEVLSGTLENSNEIDVSNISPGLYVLSALTTNGEHLTTKFIKE